jgi:CRP-like cAMP-binding protein
MLSTIEKVILLQKIDEFSEVPTAQLAQLAAIATEVTILKGDEVFRENDPPEALYLVLEGLVRMEKGGQEISLAKKDEVFGRFAIFDEEPHLFSAIAAEDSRLLRLDREDFFDLLSDHVQIVQSVIKTIVRRLRDLAGKVA